MCGEGNSRLSAKITVRNAMNKTLYSYEKVQAAPKATSKITRGKGGRTAGTRSRVLKDFHLEDTSIDFEYQWANNEDRNRQIEKPTLREDKTRDLIKKYLSLSQNDKDSSYYNIAPNEAIDKFSQLLTVEGYNSHLSTKISDNVAHDIIEIFTRSGGVPIVHAIIRNPQVAHNLLDKFENDRDYKIRKVVIKLFLTTISSWEYSHAFVLKGAKINFGKAQMDISTAIAVGTAATVITPIVWKIAYNEFLKCKKHIFDTVENAVDNKIRQLPTTKQITKEVSKEVIDTMHQNRRLISQIGYSAGTGMASGVQDTIYNFLTPIWNKIKEFCGEAFEQIHEHLGKIMLGALFVLVISVAWKTIRVKIQGINLKRFVIWKAAEMATGEVGQAEMDLPGDRNFLLGTIGWLFSKLAGFKEFDWMGFIKKFAVLSAAFTSVSVGFDHFTKRIKEIIDFFYEKATGKPFFEISRLKKDMLPAVEELDALSKINAAGGLHGNTAQKVVTAYEKVRDIYYRTLPLKDAAFSTVLSISLAKNLELYQKSQAFYANSAVRDMPFSIHLVGLPGVGKTTCKDLLLHYCSDIMRGKKLEPTDIFDRKTQNEYWDGYQNQFATVVDDFLQATDSTIRFQEAMEYIYAVNRNPFHLHMAGVSDKALKYFSSQLFVTTSNYTANQFLPTNLNLTDEHALYRRMRIKVLVKKVSDSIGKDMFATACKRWSFEPITQIPGSPSKLGPAMNWIEFLKYVEAEYLQLKAENGISTTIPTFDWKTRIGMGQMDGSDETPKVRRKFFMSQDTNYDAMLRDIPEPWKSYLHHYKTSFTLQEVLEIKDIIKHKSWERRLGWIKHFDEAQHIKNDALLNELQKAAVKVMQTETKFYKRCMAWEKTWGFPSGEESDSESSSTVRVVHDNDSDSESEIITSLEQGKLLDSDLKSDNLEKGEPVDQGFNGQTNEEILGEELETFYDVEDFDKDKAIIPLDFNWDECKYKWDDEQRYDRMESDTYVDKSAQQWFARFLVFSYCNRYKVMRPNDYIHFAKFLKDTLNSESFAILSDTGELGKAHPVALVLRVIELAGDPDLFHARAHEERTMFQGFVTELYNWRIRLKVALQDMFSFSFREIYSIFVLAPWSKLRRAVMKDDIRQLFMYCYDCLVHGVEPPYFIKLLCYTLGVRFLPNGSNDKKITDYDFFIMIDNRWTSDAELGFNCTKVLFESTHIAFTNGLAKMPDEYANVTLRDILLSSLDMNSIVKIPEKEKREGVVYKEKDRSVTKMNAYYVTRWQLFMHKELENFRKQADEHFPPPCKWWVRLIWAAVGGLLVGATVSLVLSGVSALLVYLGIADDIEEGDAQSLDKYQEKKYKARKNKPTVHTKKQRPYQGNAEMSESTSGIINRATANLEYITVHAGGTEIDMHMFFVLPYVAFTAAHAFNLSYKVESLQLHWSTNKSSSGSIFIPPNKYRTTVLPDRDLIRIEFDKDLFPAKRDMKRHLRSNKEPWPDDCGPVINMMTSETGAWLFPTAKSAIKLDSYIQQVDDFGRMTQTSFKNVWKVGMKGGKGKCGQPYFVDNDAFPKKLAWLHIGGAHDDSYVAPIYLEDLPVEQGVAEMEMGDLISPDGYGINVDYTKLPEPIDGLKSIGTMSKNYFMSKEVNIYPTKLQSPIYWRRERHESPYLVQKVPVRMKSFIDHKADPPVYIDPFKNMLKKFGGREIKTYPRDPHDKELWKGIFHKSFNWERIRRLTRDEAINGVQGSRILGPMDCSASAAWGFSDRGQSLNDMFPLVGDKRTVRPDVEEWISKKELRAQHWILDHFVNIYCGKAELKLKGKEYNPRGFFNGEKAHMVHAKQVMGMLIEEICNHTGEGDVYIGINPHSSEWRHLYNKMKWQELEVILADDVEKWDLNFKFFFAWLFCEEIRVRLDLSWEDPWLAEIFVIVISTLAPYIVIGNGLYQALMMPSGAWLTAVLNSIFNSWLNRYCFREHRREINSDFTKHLDTLIKIVQTHEPLFEWGSVSKFFKAEGEYCVPFSFDELIKQGVFGDDCLQSVRAIARWFWNGVVKANLMWEHFGMRMTPVNNKNSSVVPWTHLTVETWNQAAGQFLKRQFRMENGNIYPILDPVSIESMVLWYTETSSMTKEQLVKQCIETAMREWFYYGKERFESEWRKLKPYYLSLGFGDLPFRHQDLFSEYVKNFI